MIGGLNRYSYLGSLSAGTGPRNRDQGTTGYVGLQLKIPIYEGGRVNAQTRQAREKYGASLEQIAFAEREVVAETRSAFANWRSAQRVIDAARSGAAADARAPARIRARTTTGSRPPPAPTHPP